MVENQFICWNVNIYNKEKEMQAAKRRGSSGSKHRWIATAGEVSRNWIGACDRKEGLAYINLSPK